MSPNKKNGHLKRSKILFENDKLILLIKIMIFNEDVFVTVSETKDEEVATTIKQASPPPTVEATQ